MSAVAAGCESCGSPDACTVTCGFGLDAHDCAGCLDCAPADSEPFDGDRDYAGPCRVADCEHGGFSCCGAVSCDGEHDKGCCDCFSLTDDHERGCWAAVKRGDDDDGRGDYEYDRDRDDRLTGTGKYAPDDYAYPEDLR